MAERVGHLRRTLTAFAASASSLVAEPSPGLPSEAHVGSCKRERRLAEREGFGLWAEAAPEAH